VCYTGSIWCNGKTTSMLTGTEQSEAAECKQGRCCGTESYPLLALSAAWYMIGSYSCNASRTQETLCWKFHEHLSHPGLEIHGSAAIQQQGGHVHVSVVSRDVEGCETTLGTKKESYGGVGGERVVERRGYMQRGKKSRTHFSANHCNAILEACSYKWTANQNMQWNGNTMNVFPRDDKIDTISDQAI